ncbi:COG1361 family protein [Streptomyces ureilyticus]|uniref:DUF11 domain-containing protein n=1 Tax=Streptomyces ureilyticus TaxID=1775131 RepID=A0ABX0DW04_9ACTN|nr:hypothetical protein [Streptomyces ureilyticus]NGO46107.1 hypothetical protein [Streptomyces ureilyticus]
MTGTTRRQGDTEGQKATLLAARPLYLNMHTIMYYAGMNSRQTEGAPAVPSGASGTLAKRAVERQHAVVVRWVLAAVLLLVAALTGVGQHAAAAENGPRNTTQKFFHMPLHSTKKTRPDMWLPLSFAHNGPSRNAELTVDASGIDNVAVLAPDSQQVIDHCTTGTPSFTCSVRLNSDTRELLNFRPAEGAQAGDTGILHYALKPEGLPAVRGSVTMIAGWPELRVSKSPISGDLPVGQTTNVPILIRNTGDVPARGIVLRFDDTDYLSTAVQHSNCRYPRDGETGRAVQCMLPDAIIAPGETWRVTPALRVKPARDASGEFLSYGAWPFHTAGRGSSGACCVENPDPGLTPGNAAPLSLTRDPADGKGRTFTTNREPTITRVPVRTTADVEVFGASVRGEVGSRHRIRIGYRNNGPARLGWPSIEFIAPPGTEVTQAPYDPGAEENVCVPGHNGRSYTCIQLADFAERIGQKVFYEFELRITSKDSRSGCVAVSGTRTVKDPQPGNDKAPVRVAENGGFSCSLPEPKDDGVSGWATGAGIAAVTGAVLLVVRHRRRKAAASSGRPPTS